MIQPDTIQNPIRHILVPVKPDAASLITARQVAEFARSHGAEIHLLHLADINDCRNRIFGLFTRTGAGDFYRLTKEKTDLLSTWKRWLEKEYGIQVQVTVDWCNWRSGVLAYAEKLEVDLIALTEDQGKRQGFFRLSDIEYVIEKSNCPVITCFSREASMNDWKQIVLPVTDCVPETRINAVADIARALKVKVHLVTMSSPDKEQDSNFYFLAETLKRLKPGGNITVECRCIRRNGNIASGFLNYTKSIGADILLTSLRSNLALHPKPKEAYYFMDYV